MTLIYIPWCFCTWLAVCGRAGWRLVTRNPMCPADHGSDRDRP
jgi:hypothetical protein